MRFPPRFLEDLRDRAPLAEMVGRRVKLTRSGREHKGLCPFHNEKTPSFHVVEDKNFYHCFGCGAHGDAIGWLMDGEGLSFPEAVEQLAARLGLPLPEPDPADRQRAEKQAGLHDVTEAAARYFQERLGGNEGREARAYLERRGLSMDTIQRFRLGFAPDSYDALPGALKDRGIDENLLLEAGLAVRPDDGRRPYARFRNRIIFPITDRRGRIVAFGGRAMDDNPAKYINSPETPIFHKGRMLYNLAGARKPAHDAGSVIVVEGYMDVIALAQDGIDHAVAPLGTAVTEDQIAELWRLAPEPVLCFDGDQAGLRAAARALDRALPLLAPGQSLRFALLPQGLDPDDLIRREGRVAMRRVLDSALPLAEMLWRVMTEGADISTPERRAGLEKSIFGKLAKIGDDRVRGFYNRDFRERLYQAFAPRRASGGFQRGRRGTPTPGHRPRPDRPSGLTGTVLGRSRAPQSSQSQEQLLVYAMLNHPWLAEKYSEEAAELPLTDPELDKLRQELLVSLDKGGDLDCTSLRNHLADSGFADLIARLDRSPVLQPVGPAQPDAVPEDAEAVWVHLLARLRRRALEREIAEIEAAYRTDRDDATLERLLRLKRALHSAKGMEAETGAGEAGI